MPHRSSTFTKLEKTMTRFLERLFTFLEQQDPGYLLLVISMGLVGLALLIILKLVDKL